MELMTSSLEKTYKAVHKILQQRIPEDILGKIAYCVSTYFVVFVCEIKWGKYDLL